MSLFGKLFGKKEKTEKKKLPEEEDGQIKYMKPKEKTPEPQKGAPAAKEVRKEEPKQQTPAKEEAKVAEAPAKTAAGTAEDAKKEQAPAPVKDTAPEKKTPAPVKESAPEKKAPAAKQTVKPAAKKPAPAKKEEVPAAKETKAADDGATEEAEKIATDTASESVALPTKTGPVGKFDLKKSKDGRFVFNLLAANRVIVATSQVYSSSTAAMNGIHSVIVNAEKAPVEDQTLKNYTPVGYPKWEIYLDKGNQYRFRLSASNGSCICHSQGYTTKASCKNGIESIIRTVKDANTEKSYLKKDDKKDDAKK